AGASDTAGGLPTGLTARRPPTPPARKAKLIPTTPAAPPDSRGHPQKGGGVCLEGYGAGRVDDFDGPFQRLNVAPGPHELTLFLPGYRTVTERVYIGEGSTLKLKQSLEKLAPGETSTPPPAPPKPERRTRGRRADAGDDRDDR